MAGGPHTAEEQIWAQSTLFAAMGHFQKLLQKGEYLSDSNDVLVTPYVEFFRRSAEQGYRFVHSDDEVKTATVLSMALYNFNAGLQEP